MLNNLFVDCMTMLTVGLMMVWVELGRNLLIKWWVGLGFESGPKAMSES